MVLGGGAIWVGSLRFAVFTNDRSDGKGRGGGLSHRAGGGRLNRAVGKRCGSPFGELFA